ncbi:MAG: methyltransferase [Bacteroidetes bacterium]|nr:methyltransferase [Bacteroidota bacterium]
MSFRFRQFKVEDSHSTMKVGTDAMLLGSWVKPADASSILDIGTGCGVLALMMAQGSGAQIDAIDIHGPSVDEATYNVSQSPWPGRIRVFLQPVEDHAFLGGLTYDIIISNPPFFNNSLKPSSSKKLLAKHEHTLTLGILLTSSLKLMHPGSSLCLILPTTEGKMFTSMAEGKGLFPFKRLTVSPLSSRLPHRILTEFRFLKPAEVIEDELTIHSADGGFSEKYLSMTQNFHLFHPKRT